MAGNIFLKSCSAFSLETSGIIITASSAGQAAAADYDNSTGLAFWGTVELNAACGTTTAPAVNTTIDLYLIPAPDGTNFASLDANTPNMPANHYKGSFVWPVSSSSPKRMMIESIPLSARLYRPYIVNRLGVTLNCGWTLKLYPDLEQYT